MPKYVIANRLVNTFENIDDSGQHEVLSLLNSLPHTRSDLIGQYAERTIALIDADSDEIKSLVEKARPGIIIEPLSFYKPLNIFPIEFSLSKRYLAQQSNYFPIKQLLIAVTGGGNMLPDIHVKLFIRRFGFTNHLEGTTDQHGECQFEVPDDCDVAGVAILPRARFWPVIVRGISSQQQTIDCPVLPSGFNHLWWHDQAGVSSNRMSLPLGKGVRVGVIDSGCGHHFDLDHVNHVGSFSYFVHNTSPASAFDVGSHGTHVAGIIGSSPSGQDPIGIAPECDIFVARVLDDLEAGATNGDIAVAIDYLSDVCSVDLINISLGGGGYSVLIHDAIKAAEGRGTLCICAAGNNAGAVEYPAAYPESVAVAAIGKSSWAPPGTLSYDAMPSEPDKFGRSNLFAATFSSRGDRIACSAPGVGIISTVAEVLGSSSSYGVMDGTSMACPVACGTLAVLLSREPSFLSLPRDVSRAQAARHILNLHSRDIGLPTPYQGRGVPMV